MSRSEKSTRAFNLSLIAGFLILANAASVAAATWFLWIIPTLPGSSGNGTTILYSAAAVGLVRGVVLLFGATILCSKPEYKRALA